MSLYHYIPYLYLTELVGSQTRLKRTISYIMPIHRMVRISYFTLRKIPCSLSLAILDRRIYPLQSVLMTATLVCVSVWYIPGDPAGPDSNYSSITKNPFNLSLLHPNDSYSLIDINNFTFLKTGFACNSSPTPLFIVIVHSATHHRYKRQIIRDTWGRDSHLVFMLGETNSSDVQETLDREESEYHDIVQGNFLDTYRNLTYKHVMGLKWVTYHCPWVKYVLKVDDDVFVNTPFLLDYLTRHPSPLDARRLVLCDGVAHHALVQRSHKSKWRVSYSEYSDRYYPKYCFGLAIMYSTDVVFLLYREAQRSEYFWVDDVHITGTLVARLNLTHTWVGSLAIPESYTNEMINLGKPNKFFFRLVRPANVSKLWSFVKLSFKNFVSKETKTS